MGIIKPPRKRAPGSFYPGKRRPLHPKWRWRPRDRRPRGGTRTPLGQRLDIGGGPGTDGVMLSPTAPLYGPGPSYVVSTAPAPYSPPETPYAPTVGRDHLSHGQVAKDAHFGNPRPPARLAPERHTLKVKADENQRHSVEDVDGDGWMGQSPGIHTSVPYQPAVAANRAVPHALYSFTRPFDQDMARELNGNHFSMADHRRNYPIGGMAPAKSARNTYRLEPTPWDSTVIDMPADIEPDTPQAVITGPGYPNSDFFGGGRSYRSG